MSEYDQGSEGTPVALETGTAEERLAKLQAELDAMKATNEYLQQQQYGYGGGYGGYSSGNNPGSTNCNGYPSVGDVQMARAGLSYQPNETCTVDTQDKWFVNHNGEGESAIMKSVVLGNMPEVRKLMEQHPNLTTMTYSQAAKLKDKSQVLVIGDLPKSGYDRAISCDAANEAYNEGVIDFPVWPTVVLPYSKHTKAFADSVEQHLVFTSETSDHPAAKNVTTIVKSAVAKASTFVILVGGRKSEVKQGKLVHYWSLSPHTSTDDSNHPGSTPGNSCGHKVEDKCQCWLEEFVKSECTLIEIRAVHSLYYVSPFSMAKFMFVVDKATGIMPKITGLLNDYSSADGTINGCPYFRSARFGLGWVRQTGLSSYDGYEHSTLNANLWLKGATYHHKRIPGCLMHMFAEMRLKHFLTLACVTWKTSILVAIARQVLLKSCHTLSVKGSQFAGRENTGVTVVGVMSPGYSPQAKVPHPCSAKSEMQLLTYTVSDGPYMTRTYWFNVPKKVIREVMNTVAYANVEDEVALRSAIYAKLIDHGYTEECMKAIKAHVFKVIYGKRRHFLGFGRRGRRALIGLSLLRQNRSRLQRIAGSARGAVGKMHLGIRSTILALRR
jgi:hypothetical protein